MGSNRRNIYVTDNLWFKTKAMAEEMSKDVETSISSLFSRAMMSNLDPQYKQVRFPDVVWNKLQTVSKQLKSTPDDVINRILTSALKVKND